MSDAGKKAAQLKRSPRAANAKRAIVAGVAAAVVVVAGAGFWVWHDQPSFCSAICHNAMGSYNATYDQASGMVGVDKWGNVVGDAGDLLVVQHKEQADATCLSCHMPVLTEQVTEAAQWATGSYAYPLTEASMQQLNAYGQHETPNEFCMNESCHNVTVDDLKQATAGYARNPHQWLEETGDHATFACGDCHKSHRQSVMQCTRCHADAEVPTGWISAADERQLDAAYL